MYGCSGTLKFESDPLIFEEHDSREGGVTSPRTGEGRTMQEQLSRVVPGATPELPRGAGVVRPCQTQVVKEAFSCHLQYINKWQSKIYRIQSHRDGPDTTEHAAINVCRAPSRLCSDRDSYDGHRRFTVGRSHQHSLKSTVQTE